MRLDLSEARVQASALPLPFGHKLLIMLCADVAMRALSCH